MRRRSLLVSSAMAAAAALVPADEARAASSALRFRDALPGRSAGPALRASELASLLARARDDFRACRYTGLAERLPALVAQASAAHEQAAPRASVAAAAHLASAYHLSTELMVKLHRDAPAMVTAGRAMAAATVTGDPVIVAESSRLVATVLRRHGQRESAQKLVLDAAAQLDAATHLKSPVQGAKYAQLLAVGAYTAAMRGDAVTASALLDQAHSAIRHASPAATDSFTGLDLAVYRVSVARVLGDFGPAVGHAQHIDPAAISSLERRARFYQDVALAAHGRGRPADAYGYLLAARRETPQVVRHQPWAQHLTRSLLTADTRNALPGLRRFADSIGLAS